MSNDAELATRLDLLARKVGMVFGVPLGVGKSGDRLVFMDGDGDAIYDDGDLIIAATAPEAEAGAVFQHFWDRAGHAATIAKYQQIAASRGDS